MIIGRESTVMPGQPELILYGQVGTTNTIETRTDLSDHPIWQSVCQVTLTKLFRTFACEGVINRTVFYRAKRKERKSAQIWFACRAPHEYIGAMSYVTVEVEIDHGRILPREPVKLPEKANGLLTILQPVAAEKTGMNPPRQRVELPLIRGDGKRIIDPPPEELDASLWGA